MIGKPMMLMNKEEKFVHSTILTRKASSRSQKNQPAPVRHDADFQVYTVIIWKKRGFHEKSETNE